MMLSEATIASLKSNMRGDVIEQREASYDTARKVYNGMIDRRPRLIARCSDVADVIAAVNFGRENKWSCPFAAAATVLQGWAFPTMGSSSICRE
jgi:hypothetical protein